MKIISLVGARPQFIKLGSFSKELRKYAMEVIIHTGQHYDEKMSDLLFRDLRIPKPDYELNIGSMLQGAQTGRMLEAIELVLVKEKPDFTVVFGDTNSTLAGALASAKLGIPTIHIEAGLRSFNRQMPEEINRIVADHTSDFLFAPTKTATQNLANEGLGSKSFLTGDIMVDSLKNNLELALSQSKVEKEYELPHEFYLLTLHRPYNVDNPKNLELIFSRLGNLKKQIVFPVHPRTLKIIEANNIKYPANIKLVPPQGYLDFIKLQHLSTKIITDSGGIQKEAYLIERPCITLRPETEWVETIECGWNNLLDYTHTDFESKVLNFAPNHSPKPIFGENVAQVMVQKLLSF